MKAGLAALLCLALLAGCVGKTPAAVPPATGQIDGAVVDPLLHPFSNQTVTLVQLQRTDVTSRLGGFTFRDVPIGFYTVTTRLEDGRAATQVVDVEAGKITRVILQLLPHEGPVLRIDAFNHQSGSQLAYPNQECSVCAWSLPLEPGERPAEVLLETSWSRLGAPMSGADTLRITLTDEAGFPFFDGLLEPGQTVAIAGTDLPEDARSLDIRVTFGRDFVARPAFEMESLLSLFYGATHDEMLLA